MNPKRDEARARLGLETASGVVGTTSGLGAIAARADGRLHRHEVLTLQRGGLRPPNSALG